MNKTELIERVAQSADLSKMAAGRAVEAVLNAVQSALMAGDSVTLAGFGVFEVTERAAREGRNPKTGEPLQIAAGRVPKFRAGKMLKDAVQ